MLAFISIYSYALLVVAIGVLPVRLKDGITLACLGLALMLGTGLATIVAHLASITL